MHWLINVLRNYYVPGIMLSTFHDFLGYSSEVDTIMIHIVQMSKLKHGGTVNSRDVTASPMYSRDVSASNPTSPWPESPVLASQCCSVPGGHGPCVFIIMIINTWVTPSKPENITHHYCPRSLSKILYQKNLQ